MDRAKRKQLEEQLQNCLLAVMLWKTVPARKVDLDLWHCGTRACFGGWLTTWPEFRAKGVCATGEITGESSYWEPALTRKGRVRDAFGAAVANELFGDADLFDLRQWSEHTGGSDHKVVQERLRRRIGEIVDELGEACPS